MCLAFSHCWFCSWFEKHVLVSCHSYLKCALLGTEKRHCMFSFCPFRRYKSCEWIVSLLCHILFSLFIFFSVPLCSELCMPLSAGQGSLLVCFMTCFCEVKTQDASDSHCDTNTNCSRRFSEWLLTPGLYPCFAQWGCWGACSFLETTPQTMERTDKPVMCDYLCPAVQPDKAGRSLNLAWNSLWR